MKFKELDKRKVSEVEADILKSWGGIDKITEKQNELRKGNKDFVLYTFRCSRSIVNQEAENQERR